MPTALLGPPTDSSPSPIIFWHWLRVRHCGHSCIANVHVHCRVVVVHMFWWFTSCSVAVVVVIKGQRRGCSGTLLALGRGCGSFVLLSSFKLRCTWLCWLMFKTSNSTFSVCDSLSPTITICLPSHLTTIRLRWKFNREAEEGFNENSNKSVLQLSSSSNPLLWAH